MRFFVGLHQPSDARHFKRAMISVNRLRGRKSDFEAGGEWIMDSGAFTQISTHGEYHTSPQEYADEVNRWARCGRMVAAVSQDYMCEGFILARTGKSVEEHQALTIERYRTLIKHTSAYVMPVLQGYYPHEYVEHIQLYGSLLKVGMWVGVGSVCKRNSTPGDIAGVLSAIKFERPDLRLHGFGVKTTALGCSYIRSLLYSADSMAWSYAARKDDRNANDWREAMRFVENIEGLVAA